MESKTFRVPNISCGHCVMTIRREVGALPGVQSVEGDAATRTISVHWQAPATWERIREVLDEINYPPE